MNSKLKGNRGERELVSLLREKGFDAHRNPQWASGGKENPDVSLPGVHIEVKRTESLRLYNALKQAQGDSAAGILPVVMHRRNNAPWVVIMALEDWLKLYARLNK